MALWMEAGSEPKTESEVVDVEAISALKQSAAIELKMFSESSPPLPWDNEHAYTRGALELYYEADSGVSLSKREIFLYLLDGTAAAHLEKFESEENDVADKWTNATVLGGGGTRWIKEDERRRLYDVLKEPNLVVPGIPVFYVVSKKSSFYKVFKSGKWSPPEVA